MNQHYDFTLDSNPDEFEKRLSEFSLISATDHYGQIPARLHSTLPEHRPLYWKWLVGGAAACLLIALAITKIDFLDFDTEIIQKAASHNVSAIDISQQSSAGGLAGEPEFVSGIHYIELQNPISVPDTDTIETVAFFWYPCNPCSEFEAYLTQWESELSNGVVLRRIPAIWSSEMRFHARAYYTAAQLGVVDDVHRQFFIEFARNRPAIRNEEDLLAFFVSIGVSASRFSASYHAETTLNWLQQAESENMTYQVQSTPSLFVAGKYAISPLGAGGLREMIEVANFLIQKESN